MLRGCIDSSPARAASVYTAWHHTMFACKAVFSDAARVWCKVVQILCSKEACCASAHRGLLSSIFSESSIGSMPVIVFVFERLPTCQPNVQALVLCTRWFECKVAKEVQHLLRMLLRRPSLPLECVCFNQLHLTTMKCLSHDQS